MTNVGVYTADMPMYLETSKPAHTKKVSLIVFWFKLSSFKYLFSFFNTKRKVSLASEAR